MEPVSKCIFPYAVFPKGLVREHQVYLSELLETTKIVCSDVETTYCYLCEITSYDNKMTAFALSSQPTRELMVANCWSFTLGAGKSIPIWS